MARLVVTAMFVPLFATLVTQVFAAGPKFLQEPFDATKFQVGHVWWVDSFTESIYGNADRCAHFVVKKKGDDFLLESQFIAADGELVEVDLVVKEDKSHPARFFLEAGGAVVMEIGVVATDYNNWSIVWAQSNGNAAYHVVTTKPQNQEPFQDKLNEVFDKLGYKAADFKKGLPRPFLPRVYKVGPRERRCKRESEGCGARAELAAKGEPCVPPGPAQTGRRQAHKDFSVLRHCPPSRSCGCYRRQRNERPLSEEQPREETQSGSVDQASTLGSEAREPGRPKRRTPNCKHSRVASQCLPSIETG
ncbi:hypothetical protein BIW11_12956 [Tropilaelaps mercedesae]|uniref:Lipocalin/cytosolic fatty-acid binding domain-containing protein n=1 Tax=Tropilaelaps mercedesae TaxID=418985 RepID=A0A1V9X4R9_9ACAR|nr:hypothetical protein BIW11_12956 [Tropilaelaps mercedesae]